jgi:hypothetical protein
MQKNGRAARAAGQRRAITGSISIRIEDMSRSHNDSGPGLVKRPGPEIAHPVPGRSFVKSAAPGTLGRP